MLRRPAPLWLLLLLLLLLLLCEDALSRIVALLVSDLRLFLPLVLVLVLLLLLLLRYEERLPLLQPWRAVLLLPALQAPKGEELSLSSSSCTVGVTRGS